MAMQVRRYVISDYEGEYYFDYDSDDEGGVRRRKRINQCVDIMV